MKRSCCRSVCRSVHRGFNPRSGNLGSLLPSARFKALDLNPRLTDLGAQSGVLPLLAFIIVVIHVQPEILGSIPEALDVLHDQAPLATQEKELAQLRLQLSVAVLQTAGNDRQAGGHAAAGEPLAELQEFLRIAFARFFTPVDESFQHAVPGKVSMLIGLHLECTEPSVKVFRQPRVVTSLPAVGKRTIWLFPHLERELFHQGMQLLQELANATIEFCADDGSVLFHDRVMMVRSRRPLSTSSLTILLLGSTGYLGSHVKARFPDALTPRVDITDRAAVAAALESLKPDVVINCAGKTGRPNVDWCEDHKFETLSVNVTGALVLLQECAARHIRLVHYGSGCIYAGDNQGRGWKEDDPPNFYGSFYSRTKAWSDQMLREFPDDVLNLRLRMPFDGSDHPRNLIMKLSQYRRVLDEPNSITSIPELINVTAELLARGITGTFNVVNPGPISPYRIMELYKEVVDPGHMFERLTADTLGEVAKAPRSNCILNGQKLASLGIRLTPAEAAVRGALLEIRSRKIS